MTDHNVFLGLVTLLASVCFSISAEGGSKLMQVVRSLLCVLLLILSILLFQGLNLVGAIQ